MSSLNIQSVFRDRTYTKKTRPIFIWLRINMTPMVDLGFLLIAFFIFTAQLTRPVTTNLFMPHDGIPTNTAASKSLTFLLGANDRLFYYAGEEKQAVSAHKVFSTSYRVTAGAGEIIRNKQSALQRNNIQISELTVLIKPLKECNYKNVVDLLDEMVINGVTRYAIVEPGTFDLKFMSSYY